MTEAHVTDRANKRSLAGMLTEVIFQMDGCLERLITLTTFEVSNVIVMGLDMSFQSARFAKALIAVFTPDLSSDPMGSQVVTERISVGIQFFTDIALEVIPFVRGLMDASGGSVVKLGRTPIANVFALQIIFILLDPPINVGGDGIPRNMQSQMSPKVLAIRKTL